MRLGKGRRDDDEWSVYNREGEKGFLREIGNFGKNEGKSYFLKKI